MKREDIESFLAKADPTANYADDETFYGKIYEHYLDYAELLTERQRQNDEDAERQGILKESLGALAGFQEEHGIEDAAMESAKGLYDTIAEEVRTGRISTATIEELLKAVNYDRDVEAAEIKGRNAKIEEEEYRVTSDGLPHLRGMDGGAHERPLSIFDIARR